VVESLDAAGVNARPTPLSPLQRHDLLRRALDDDTLEQIAAARGVSIASVARSIQRASAKLRRRLAAA
jgi:DNA-directed RNA polymerase specialized sigma24 family protein